MVSSGGCADNANTQHLNCLNIKHWNDMGVKKQTSAMTTIDVANILEWLIINQSFSF